MSNAQIKKWLYFVGSVALALAVIRTLERRYPIVGQLTSGV